MRDMLRLGAFGLVTGSLLVMLYHAPMPVLRELQFVAGILLITVATRSLSAESAVSALALGMGLVVFLTVGAGAAVTWIGLDTSDGIANWILIPLVEEALKLTPVAFAAWAYWRRRMLTPNPSDLLMLGCAAGAGFALVENVALVETSLSAARDMERQYGPHLGSFYFVPGAWGAVGYAGHAAATGFIAGGFGIALAIKERLGARWWIVAAACAAWILVEHMFTNLYVGTGTSIAMILGNGALTPWLFVVMAGTIAGIDLIRARRALAKSRTLTWRLAVTRAAILRTKPPVPRSRVTALRMYLTQLRLLNATAWCARHLLNDRPPRSTSVETL